MPQTAKRNRFRACLLTASLAFVPFAFADLFEPLPVALPADSTYNIPNTCVSVVCLDGITLSNFTDINNTFSDGNILTTANVSLMANVFQNLAGTPGAFISPITLNGQIDITYFAKAALSEQGTFSDQITLLDLTGSFNGHTVSAQLNPAQPSTGQTTVTEVSATPPEYRISSFFDVFTELSIDNGPYIPGPERVANLGQTPEPAYYGAIGILLVAILVRRAVGAKSPAEPSQAS